MSHLFYLKMSRNDIPSYQIETQARLFKWKASISHIILFEIKMAIILWLIDSNSQLSLSSLFMKYSLLKIEVNMICVETISIIVPQTEVTNKNNHLNSNTNSDICQ